MFLWKISLRGVLARSLCKISTKVLLARSLYKVPKRGLLAIALYEISVQALCKSPLGKIYVGHLLARSLQWIFLQCLCTRSMYKRSLGKRIRSLSKNSMADLCLRMQQKTSGQDVGTHSLSIRDLYARSLSEIFIRQDSWNHLWTRSPWLWKWAPRYSKWREGCACDLKICATPQRERPDRPRVLWQAQSAERVLKIRTAPQRDGSGTPEVTRGLRERLQDQCFARDFRQKLKMKELLKL